VKGVSLGGGDNIIPHAHPLIRKATIMRNDMRFRLSALFKDFIFAFACERGSN